MGRSLKRKKIVGDRKSYAKCCVRTVGQQVTRDGDLYGKVKVVVLKCVPEDEWDRERSERRGAVERGREERDAETIAEGCERDGSCWRWLVTERRRWIWR